MSRPNVVVVCCDDLGYGDLGCYGAEYDTPNVDGLAADGVKFTDWHSTAPVCSPSRASLLTGQYPSAAGVPSNVPGKRPREESEHGLPPETTTLAERLCEDGYQTGAFGKWHLGLREDEGPNAHGFDDYFGFLSGCVDYYSHQFVWRQAGDVPPYHDLWEDETEVWHNGEYLTELITDRAVDFFESAGDDDEPFFTYVAYNAPHYPMHVPEEYLDRYPNLDPDRRVFAAMVAAVDNGVGRIVETLREMDEYEDTIFVFTSDHGPSREVRNHLDGSDEPYMGGRTGGLRGHKGSLMEGGIRVPGIVSYPAEIKGGRVSDEFAVSFDLVPTVLETCDIEAPDPLDGESLRDVLTENESSPHDRVYWHHRQQLAVRDGDWKLVLDGYAIEDQPDDVHLSDLGEDPNERENLAESHPEVVDELERDLRKWHERIEAE